MSEAKSQIAFGRAASNFDVAESDYIVMTEEGITSFEKMAYRLPTSADLEEFLRNTVRRNGGYRDQDGKTTIYQRPDMLSWSDYKSGDDPGCIRKLWNLSLQVSKKELEALASPEDQSKRKVTVTMAQEMEDRAVSEGMPSPMNDRERPSLYCLSKVVQAYMELGEVSTTSTGRPISTVSTRAGCGAWRRCHRTGKSLFTPAPS